MHRFFWMPDLSLFQWHLVRLILLLHFLFSQTPLPPFSTIITTNLNHSFILKRGFHWIPTSYTTFVKEINDLLKKYLFLYRIYSKSFTQTLNKKFIFLPQDTVSNYVVASYVDVELLFWPWLCLWWYCWLCWWCLSLVNLTCDLKKPLPPLFYHFWGTCTLTYYCRVRVSWMCDNLFGGYDVMIYLKVKQSTNKRIYLLLFSFISIYFPINWYRKLQMFGNSNWNFINHYDWIGADLEWQKFV